MATESVSVRLFLFMGLGNRFCHPGARPRGRAGIDLHEYPTDGSTCLARPQRPTDAAERRTNCGGGTRGDRGKTQKTSARRSWAAGHVQAAWGALPRAVCARSCAGGATSTTVPAVLSEHRRERPTKLRPWRRTSEAAGMRRTRRGEAGSPPIKRHEEATQPSASLTICKALMPTEPPVCRPNAM